MRHRKKEHACLQEMMPIKEVEKLKQQGEKRGKGEYRACER